MNRAVVAMVLLAGLFVPASELYAQQDVAETESEQWYTIELLVFAYNKRDPDYIPVARELPDLNGLIELVPAAIEESLDEVLFPGILSEPVLPTGVMFDATIEETAQEQPFEELESTLFSLDAAAKRLAAHPSYRPLAHLAWRQPEYEFLKGPNVHIRGGRAWQDPESFYSRPFHTLQEHPEAELRFTDELEGFVSLTHGRFNHLEVDLVLRLPARSRSNESPWIGRRNERQTSAFLIRQQRRIHLDRLQYFDHPQFGVLAMVSAFTPEPTEATVDDQDGVLVYPNTGS